MKDEDIKLPEVSGSTFSVESPLWRAILRLHEAKGLSCMARAIDIDNEVKNLMTEYAREAVRLNQPCDTTQGQAKAWRAVANELSKNDKYWYKNGESGRDAAVKTIQDLFDKANKEPSKPIPFDLEAAKRGEAIVTRDGRKARFLAHEPSFKDGYQLMIKVEGESAPMPYHNCGSFVKDYESEYDLFMAPKPKRVVYLNIYSDSSAAAVHASESSAREAASPSCEITALPVELP